MKIHDHAYNDNKHLFIVEVNLRQRGQWGGYVELRAIETNDEVAQKIGEGTQKNFTDQEGLKVLASGEGNFLATGPRSAYGKSMNEVAQVFNERKTQEEMQDGFIKEPSLTKERWQEFIVEREKKQILDALEAWSPSEDKVEETQGQTMEGHKQRRAM